MKADLKTKWVEALRSGDYQQGRKYLRKANVHTGVVQWCCLGVLCEISGKGHWDGDAYVVGVGGGGGENGVWLLPFHFREEIGISVNQESELAYMNDAPTAFATIAHYIEENL